MKILFFCLLFLIVSFSLPAQEKDSIICPKIIINGPKNNIAYSGQRAEFSVKPFNKAYSKTHTVYYKWFVTNSNILSGQNERTVYVDTKFLEGQQIKVMVMVDGLEDKCPSTETIVVDVRKPIVRTEQRIISRP